MYYVTESSPLTDTLLAKAMNQKEHIKSNFDFNIEEFSLIKDRSREPSEDFNVIEKIPSEFWMHQTFVQLPANFNKRQIQCNRMVDGFHRKNCSRLVANPKDFHLESKDETCECKDCGQKLEWFHICKMIYDTIDTDTVNNLNVS